MNATVRRRSGWLLTGLLFFCSLSILAPMYLTVVTALKTRSDTGSSLWGLPHSLHWGNFSEAIRVTHFWHALGNSLLLTAVVVVVTVLTNSLVGYAIARNMHRRAFRGVFFYFLSALFIPFPIIMLPLVKELSRLGLDNLGGLALLYVVYNLPFNVLLYTGYMRTIPIAIDEAATIDGANSWQRFWRVIFPLLTPANATVAILTGLSTWNDFLLPLVVLSNQNQYTLPLTQYAFQGQFSTNYNLAFSSYLMAMAPMMIIYLLAQRWIIGGVANGAVK
ncbi:carbohydrate ABC transporter permease [Streptomyces shenzhenensis]